MVATTSKLEKNDCGTRIGYLLRMYPRFSQTFVVNELLELERQDADLKIASLRFPNEGLFHESVTRVRASVDYFSDRLVGQFRKQIRAQWRLFRQHRGNYARAVRLITKHPKERWFELVQAAELLRWTRKHHIDHVHVHFGTEEATVALLANMLGGLSYSLTLHAFDIFRDNVDRKLLSQKINASRFTVTVCESNRQFMMDNLPGLDKSKIEVVYNGIDSSRFKPDGVTRTPMTIFAVGRLIEKKGFDDLIRAIDALRGRGLLVKCEIAGEGRDRQSLERTIEELGLCEHVKLIGSLEQSDIRAKMQHASCFALPCIQAADGNIDALPTVLLESLACGCPTVSTQLSGIPEIIENNRSGLLVAPGDVNALADAIERILTDEHLAESLSLGGRKRTMERFDVASNVASLRYLLRNATDRETSIKQVKTPRIRSCETEEARAPQTIQ